MDSFYDKMLFLGLGKKNVIFMKTIKMDLYINTRLVRPVYSMSPWCHMLHVLFFFFFFFEKMDL